MNTRLPLFFSLLFFSFFMVAQEAPLKVAVIGLTHTHVHWILGRQDRGDIEIVGIVEANEDLARRYTEQHGLSIDLVYPTMEALVAARQPEAVCAFGTIYAHLAVTEFFAPRGVHVMVEKPLAVSVKHARKMAALSRKHKIHLLTNYETTWYPTNHKARELLEEGAVGPLRKAIIRDGHRGPKKIGVNSEFLDWLTDPVLNGGGALTDFGCYGVNLITWLRHGQRPGSVTAITQQLQPENNPLVDDEATILLTYPDATAIIQASWNWPIGRKDMELHGLTGSIFADNRNDLRLRVAEGYDGFAETKMALPERPAPYDDPFALLEAVVRGRHILQPHDLSALENNVLVVEVLEAAAKSARKGRSVKF
nr:Gfo/Idh/MocA family oxidoreductase [Neolewinella persica]